MCISVSIVVTNYNYLSFLPQCIESIRSQDPDELIIVDDGSTDASQDWLLENCSGFAQVICKTNGGQASAMNAGFAASSGDLVWFVDADDVLFPGAIEAVRNAWREGFSKLHVRCRLIDGEGHPGRVFPRSFIPLPQGDISAICRLMGAYPSSPTSGNIYDRGYLQAVMPIPEQFYRICADAYLHDRAPFRGQLGAISQALVGYRVHGNNAFAQANPRRNKNWLEMKIGRLRGKWASLHPAGTDAGFLARLLFLISPDYLRLERQLTADGGWTAAQLPELVSDLTRVRSNCLVRVILSILKSGPIFSAYQRLWVIQMALSYRFLRRK